MRRMWLFAIAGLLTSVCLLPVQARDAKVSPAKKALAAESTCGDYGTTVEFEASPSDAARKALKEEKLVLVLHVSGDFENPDFTWNNAEALRVNALANPQVGKFVNEYFCSAFQRVGTFRIVGKAKQGGNVATYFCAPDGRVLHAIAGPVNADTMLREAQWVVEHTKQAMKEAKGDGAAFKAHFRKAHAEKLRTEHGLVVQPVTFDTPVAQDPNSALTYNDPTGRALAPVLPPPPIDGPDVKFRHLQETAAVAKASGAMRLADREGRGWVLGNQGRVHVLLSSYSMNKIETLYASIFQGILGERVTTQPVQVVHPFPQWQREQLNLKRGG